MIFEDFYVFSRFCRENQVQRFFTKILQKIYEINVEEMGYIFSLFGEPKLYGLRGMRGMFCVLSRCVREETQNIFLIDLLKNLSEIC